MDVVGHSSNEVEGNESTEEDDIQPVEINDVLDQTEDTLYTLPPHHRCASHTLNLVATHDSQTAAETDPVYKRQMRLTFAKMQGLWNKQDRTSVIADEIHDSLKIYILVPNATRWNSTFKSVECLKRQLLEKEEELHRVCDLANLPRFNRKDLEFMTDYCKVSICIFVYNCSH